MGTPRRDLTPQQAAVLELVAENCELAATDRSSFGFVGVQMAHTVPIEPPLATRVMDRARRQAAVAVLEHLPESTFAWFDDTTGLGFRPGMTETALRRAADLLLQHCYFAPTVGGQIYSVTGRVACTWFPAELEAAPRFLFDTAEHVLRGSGDRAGGKFVTITSQEDASAVLGRCVDLLNDLGLRQKTPREGRRARKRVELRARCTVWYIVPGTTRTAALGAETRDVSQGGLGLIVPREMSPGTILEAELSKPDGFLYIAGRVSYCRYRAPKQYEIGVAALEADRRPVFSNDVNGAAQTRTWLAGFLRGRESRS